MNELLRPGERLDPLNRNNYTIIQNPAKFCFGMDAVLLSGFAAVKEGETAVDLGAGNGIISILLAAKTPGKHFTGLEIQADNVDMAMRSIKINQLEDRITMLQGDIKQASDIFGKASFDVVTSNPPYMTGSHGLVNPDEAKAVARHEILCTFDDVAREAAALLRPGGRFYLVHRPFRLAELICTLTAYKLEPKRMKLVHPFIDKEPNMVLLECIKGGKSRITVEAPLIVYCEQGVYTDEIYSIYGY